MCQCYEKGSATVPTTDRRDDRRTKPPRAILRERILAYLRERNWSGAELARRASRASGDRIAQSSVNRITNPKSDTSPTLTTIEALAKALGVPVWSLYLENAPLDPAQLRRLERFLGDYLSLSEEGRRSVEHIVQLEARTRG